jgi:hypothetical protein
VEACAELPPDAVEVAPGLRAPAKRAEAIPADVVDAIVAVAGANGVRPYAIR